MAINLIRCDERLIHGQCITGVLRDFNIKHIILIDEETSKNPIFKRIYEMAVPPSVKIEVLSPEAAINPIQVAISDSVPNLILFKDLQAFLLIVNKVPEIKKELNVGPMSSRKGSTKVTYYTHLTEKEMEVLDELYTKGFKVYFQQTLDQNPIIWGDIRNDVMKK